MNIPIFWIVILGFVAASIAVSQLPITKYTGKPAPLEQFQVRLGLKDLNSGVFFIILLLWGVIFVVLSVGLMLTTLSVITQAPPSLDPENRDALWEWRFLLAKFTALTGVLGALVALPFTLVRIGLTRAQNLNAEEALFNDKMNAAVADLHAQRQITMDPTVPASRFNGWEDDITRRNGAIDTLRGLATERPALLPRIDQMLSVYLRA